MPQITMQRQLCTLTIMAIVLSGVSYAEHAMTVCEALSNLPRRGKTVSVIGKLVRSRHGWYLEDEKRKFEKGCPTSTRREQIGPAAISVAFTGGADDDDRPLTFATDEHQVQAKLAEYESKTHNASSAPLIAVLVGELHTRPGIKIERNSQGDFWGGGYGQSGQYRAQLVLKFIATIR